MHGASQKELNTQRSGEIGEFIDRLNKGKGEERRLLTGEHMTFRKDKQALGKWLGDMMVCYSVCLGVVLTYLSCYKS